MTRLTEKIINKETSEILAYRLKSNGDRIKANNKLGWYEDAEERGVLLRLPCTVGDTVYEISLVEPYRNPAIREMGIVDILLRDNDMYFSLQDLYDEDYDNSILSTEFGKTVFITREEAAKALEDIKALKEKSETNKVVGISLTHESRVGNCPNCKQFVVEKYDNKCPKCHVILNWSV